MTGGVFISGKIKGRDKLILSLGNRFIIALIVPQPHQHANNDFDVAVKCSIDNRFGNKAAMDELLKTAHANNMNVILDYVAHHVHQDHPLYKQKPEWTTPLYLPDGTMNTEKWDEHRLTTWFDTFLPTWKFADHALVEALTDTAMYWVENYDPYGIGTPFWLSDKLKIGQSE